MSIEVKIDNVVVSSCPHFVEDCYGCTKGGSCKGNSCSFKRAEWLEDEKEELQEKYNTLSANFDFMQRARDTFMYKSDYQEDALKKIEGIAEAVVNGVHFADNPEDLAEHFQELNKQILTIIDETRDKVRKMYGNI